MTTSPHTPSTRGSGMDRRSFLRYSMLAGGALGALGVSGALITGGGAGTGVETGLTSNKVWIGMTAPQLTAPVILQGAKLKTVAATFQKNPFCIVSSAGKPINSPQEMKGRKIGVQASNENVFKALLNTVQYDPTPLPKGEVDGWVSYVPNEPITLEAAGFKNTNFLFADFHLPLVAETLVVRQETIDNERDKLKAFIKADIQGWYDAVADPAGSATLAVTKYGKDLGLDEAEQTLEAKAQNGLVVSDDTKANGLLTMTDELIAENIEALAKAGYKIGDRVVRAAQVLVVDPE